MWDNSHMENESTIARNVRLRMENMGLGQKALSRKADLNETYVRDILKGKSLNPRQGHLQKLALALDCLVTDLTGELDVPGAGGTPKSGFRHQLLAAFDELSDQRDWETAVRIVQGFRRDDPPTTSSPRPKERAPPPNPPPGGNAARNPNRPDCGANVAAQRLPRVVDVKRR
jgi:transcriptional regulator with XRE-family HTH domain